MTTRSFFLGIVILFHLPVFAQLSDRESIVQYTLQKPDEVKRGREFQISVQFSVQSEWYIYAPTGVNAPQGMIETRGVFILPPGLSRVGNLQLPEAIFKNGHEVYYGNNIAITKAIRTASYLSPDMYEIKGKGIYVRANQYENCDKLTTT